MLELAISMGFDELFVCGPEFKKVAGNFPNAFATTAELKAWFANSAPTSRYVLIKGSRGMRMESLIDELA
jgi:UDP-N-acetylmuramyl pentapeptide synthase